MREPANASATSAGTCAFIAQVRSSWPDEPNLRPAMNTTLASFGSASICLRSSRSAAMHSMPQAVSSSRRPGSLKRATPTTRLPGAARLASRASVGPILPPTPRMMRSPGSAVELGAQRRRRRGHHLLEVLDVAEAIRQRGSGADHPESRPRMAFRVAATTLQVTSWILAMRHTPQQARAGAVAGRHRRGQTARLTSANERRSATRGGRDTRVAEDSSKFVLVSVHPCQAGRAAGVLTGDRRCASRRIAARRCLAARMAARTDRRFAATLPTNDRLYTMLAPPNKRHPSACQPRARCDQQTARSEFGWWEDE